MYWEKKKVCQQLTKTRFVIYTTWQYVQKPIHYGFVRRFGYAEYCALSEHLRQGMRQKRLYVGHEDQA